MNNMLSKELLSNVLNCTVCYNVQNIQGPYITLDVVGKGTLKISIYELMYKCKKWALPYRLKSYINDKYTGICEVKVGDTRVLTKTISSHGEHDAVFQACQWVLNNKETS